MPKPITEFEMFLDLLKQGGTYYDDITSTCNILEPLILELSKDNKNAYWRGKAADACRDLLFIKVDTLSKNACNMNNLATEMYNGLEALKDKIMDMHYKAVIDAASHVDLKRLAGLGYDELMGLQMDEF